MTDRVIQFVLSDMPDQESQRIETLSASIADTLLPSLAEAADVASPELAARTLLELAYVVGFTHRAEHSVVLLAAISEAMRSGMEDYSKEGELDLIETDEIGADEIEADAGLSARAQGARVH